MNACVPNACVNRGVCVCPSCVCVRRRRRRRATREARGAGTGRGARRRRRRRACLASESIDRSHASIHSFIHSFIHSVIHSFIHSVIHSVIHRARSASIGRGNRRSCAERDARDDAGRWIDDVLDGVRVRVRDGERWGGGTRDAETGAARASRARGARKD